MASIAEEVLNNGAPAKSIGRINADINVIYSPSDGQVFFSNESEIEAYSVIYTIDAHSSSNGVFLEKLNVGALSLPTNGQLNISDDGTYKAAYDTIIENDKIILKDITFTRLSDKVHFGANMNNQRLNGENRILLTEITTQVS